MTSWNQVLRSQGPLTAAALATGFAAPLDNLGLIAFTGEESATFLHSQLTNDVEHLGQDEVRLAGYCSPKGRLLASFLMWRDEESVFLQLPREIQAPVQKRLQMFVLRARTKASDASDGAVPLGLGGVDAEAVLRTWFDAMPEAPYRKVDHPLGTLLRVADAFGSPRYLWLAKPEALDTVAAELAERLEVGGPEAWQLSEIHAGVPQIVAGTQEQFVPQMVNLELLGGVNFKKGCYPGQEIVARSQYLGKLKRRTALATIADASVKAGAEVFSPADPAQPCGMVVNAAPNGEGGVDALVEMKLEALEQGDVRFGSATGPALQFKPLPYALDKLDV
ncbi:CAF17-like 4Fe-4S cluster assembly/insertion protein YgfZ [Massilia endophytica]|uniref:CAF17-like 4Fe-4S cluster assembly/insertion protein YgfZ n=1 Tax=Massilia endophytica TaxID=2899220 RepID=UPI001E3B1229|nr:folate-binding protein [Massilia endophytica]UGQ48619.1 folate-binding protein [Massilia endophytica]